MPSSLKRGLFNTLTGGPSGPDSLELPQRQADVLGQDALGLAPGRGASAITARLRHAIETGVYADGDQLPPERQLATAFNAARSTIRKALNQLEESGLVVRRVGSGTYVNYSGPLSEPGSDIADLISPLQLIDARLAIEPFVARLAALHATQRDLDSIQALLDRLDETHEDKDAFSRLDSEFHQHLARCSRNPLLLHLYLQINEVRTHAQWAAMREAVLSPEQIGAYNAQHRAIFEAICQRDPQAAADRIRAHLDKAHKDLLGAHSA
jgi:DNA-binding FadR family transcriptional regulator